MLPLVILLVAALGYHPSPVITRAIADAATTPEDAALLVIYGALESGLSERPAPWSWDAKAGVSCGPWQLRCNLSTTPEADAQTWLATVRRVGLASVDSSPKRARYRERLARELLGRVRP